MNGSALFCVCNIEKIEFVFCLAGHWRTGNLGKDKEELQKPNLIPRHNWAGCDHIVLHPSGCNSSLFDPGPLTYVLFNNNFHVSVRLISNRSQMTSKCGKNKKVAHEATAESVTDVAGNLPSAL